MTKKIEDAVDHLSSGLQLEKYCYGADKIEDVVLSFSENIEFMAVYVITKGRTDILPMKQCSNVTIGMKTQRFQYYFENQLVQD